MNRPVRGRVFVGIAAAFLAVAMLDGSSIASGAPLRPLAFASATPQPRTDAPVQVEDIGTALYSASATWCAPTPTQCQGWAPPARLAAVNGFRFGDAPYWIRVWRGDRFADALVVSFCRCQDTDAAVDLSVAAWTQLEPDLGIGRIAVAVEVLDWPGDSDDPPPHPDDERMRQEVRD